VGSLHGAYIPAPPDSLTGPLFRDPADPAGGIGLFRLSFCSPQNFRVFGTVLQQQRDANGKNLGYNTCDTMPDPPGNSG
jgi:hypothetical protein